MASHIPNVAEPFAGAYLTKDQRAEMAASIRALAHWVETSEFPLPSYLMGSEHFVPHLHIPSGWISDEGFIQRVGSAARLIGGKIRKGVVSYGTNFELVREFGCGVTLKYEIDRAAVCEAQEVTVVEDVTHYVPVDPDAAARAKMLQEELDGLNDAHELKAITVSEAVTKTEFICPPSLLAAEKDDKTPDIAPSTEEAIPF